MVYVSQTNVSKWMQGLISVLQYFIQFHAMNNKKNLFSKLHVTLFCEAFHSIPTQHQCIAVYNILIPKIK